jgi:predicted nucleic acid-binding protein
MEVVRGVKTRRERELLDRIFSDWQVIPVDLPVAMLAAEFLRNYKPSHGVEVVDAIIAATAQVCGLELVTLNLKHFPMFPGLTQPY